MALTAPIIHSNGTSAQRILDDYDMAYQALNEATLALQRTAPNGRDYYVVPDSLPKAEQEHMERLVMLRTIQDQLEELMEKVTDQIDEQNRIRGR